MPIVLILPYAVHKTGNTTVGVLMHGLYNGSSFVLIALARSIELELIQISGILVHDRVGKFPGFIQAQPSLIHQLR
ncbi:MAG: hypothetical protein A2V57_04680 [Candidatus Aminicenantes bacterium RBG_19FT_COMBO_65_30]|nr:MAG: hypothetical protein A2V57_04680 [Candidatus Aminicenantes bacterium RBG_19FT_COMBO_65_30]